MPSKHYKDKFQNSTPRRSNKTKALPTCPNCKSNKHIIRYGNRHTKAGPVKIYRCTDCNQNFTTKTLKHTQYPNHIILNALSTYNLGYTQTETVNRINKRFKIKISQPALSTWLKRYSDICTFNYLRKKYTIDPKEIIKKKKFYHQQVYDFKYHTLKLNIAAKTYPTIRTYIKDILTSLDDNIFKSGPRCSTSSEDIKLTLTTNILPKIKVRRMKANNATKIASLSKELASINRERHNKIQGFFLINDSATFAIEVPVYLTQKEAKTYKIPLTAPLSGHIDILQVRRGQIHILDYKPDSTFDKSTQIQLLLYSFLLSKRTNIPIENFTCAYFDDRSYYQFKPIVD
jgi:transposase-like protein